MHTCLNSTGQTVKARVFALTAALKAANTTVAVELTDPASNKIKQWERGLDAGFHGIEMTLSDKASEKTAPAHCQCCAR